MPYYAVANGRRIGVYDNWEDCKEQVNGYSYNNYRKFDTPDQAWDYVDQHSSKGKHEKLFDRNKAVACRNGNQVAIRGNYQGETSRYRRTDYTISLEHEILLHPRYFGPQLLDTVKQKLYTEVEGTCTGKYGFVVAVTTIDNIGAGIIQPGQGFVVYPVKYKAIVFRPFKGEVLDAIVTQVNKSIPEDMQFCPNVNPACYKSKEEDVVIQADDEIRLKIVGTRVDATGIFAIGTLMDDYLGLVCN
ncbi:Dna-directed rna polymerase ii subunit rpb7-like protein [Temnothorax longispinosus]|uniref:DNA-directed RNA polymerase II subunit RPB7 n=1 Tax=Temnothorax longispinosus TaxID=300112 RepID=A0A4S2KFJ8_9HYME|nr:Dna-directed rna polymerase ii subunit rpb7-like protein [Temnothorax longispinosus]